MTKEQIESTYEFAVAQRMLKREFPFIKKIELTDDWNDYHSLYFIDLVIDVKKLTDMYNIKDNTRWYVPMTTAYLSIMLRAFDNETKEILNNIEDKIKDVLTKLHTSNALTDDMRLDRKLSPSGYIRHSDTAK